MKSIKKGLGKPVSKMPNKKVKRITKRQADEKIEDVKKLVHLLQVHQVELEHQNQELRTTQEELEVSHNKYVNLFDFSPIPYFTLDQNGIIKEVNLSAGKMFGIERSKFIDRHFGNKIPLEERDIFNSLMNAVFSSTLKHSCELKVINKLKRVFQVRLEGVQIEDTLESVKKCQVALIDMTEYKRVEESLKKTTEELRVLNTTKDKFFSIIAHDLRSPFQSMLSASKLLAEEIDSLSHEEIMLCSQGLNHNLKHIYRLLENLLNWSMMQRDMLQYEPGNLNMYDLVNEVIEISLESAIRKNISISNDVDYNTVVYADIDMLQSIIQNLIMNSIKFNRSKGKVTVSCKHKDKFTEVTVQDTGVGIEAEQFSKMFDIDTLSSTNGTAGEKGTGLGLPLCKEFVAKHGGTIWIESEVGKGTKVTFTLLQRT